MIKNLSQFFSAGTGLNISLRCHPAWRVNAPPHAYHHTPDFVYGEPSPSHILGIAFLFALRSPFLSNLPAALPPPAALCEDKPGKYSLFFNGLAEDSIPGPPAQEAKMFFGCFSDTYRCPAGTGFAKAREIVYNARGSLSGAERPGRTGPQATENKGDGLWKRSTENGS